MSPPALHRDCSRCTALCCVALAFDRSEEFGFDKPAGSACPHVLRDYRCRIHAALERRGFAGCASYDCLGAGQRVTEEIFPGRSWRDHPELAAPMFRAFRALRVVHELTLLLCTAARLPLEGDQERERRGLLARLAPVEGWTAQSLERFEESPLPREVGAYLRTLRAVATGSAAGSRSLPLHRPLAPAPETPSARSSHAPLREHQREGLAPGWRGR